MITFPVYYELKIKDGVRISKPSKPCIKGWNKIEESVKPYSGQGTGIQCGKGSDLTVIDFDTVDCFANFTKHFGSIDTKTVKTPRGYHLYFKYCPELKTTQIRELNIDIRSDNGFVIGEGNCQYVNGKEVYYESINSYQPIQIPESIKNWIIEQNPKTKKPSKLVEKNPRDDASLGVEYEYFGTLDAVQYLMDRIDVFNCDWRMVTSALKGIYPSAKGIWDKWSRQDVDRYDKELNEEVWRSIKYPIHPNYLCNLVALDGMFKRSVKFDTSIKPTNVFESQYITQHLLPISMELTDMYIKSTTGTGKTTFSSELFATRFSDKRVLCITNRISLASQQVNSFAPTKFSNYQDKLNYSKIDSDPAAKLIICLNSLPKIGCTDFDVVYLDELTSLLKASFGNHMKDRCKVLLKLREILTNAKYVIATDGDLDQVAIDFIMSYRKDKPYQIYENTYKNAKGLNAVIVSNRDQMMEYYRRSIESGIYTTTCSDTKALITQLEMNGILDGLPYKAYYKDCERNLRLELADVNEHWRYHHILFSPSVVTGVDYTYDTRDVFLWITADELTNGSNLTISPQEMVQQVARSRKIRNLYVYYNGQSSHSFTQTFDEFKESVSKDLERFSALTDGKIIQLDYDDDAYTTLINKYFYYDAKSQADQLSFVMNKLMEKGFNIVQDEIIAEEPSTGTHMHRDISKVLKYLDKRNVIEIDKEYVDSIDLIQMQLPNVERSKLHNKLQNDFLVEYNLAHSQMLDGVRKRVDILGLDVNGFMFSLAKFDEISNLDKMVTRTVSSLLECDSALRGYLDYWKLTKLEYHPVDPIDPYRNAQFNMLVKILASCNVSNLNLSVIDCSSYPNVVDEKTFRKYFKIDSKTKSPLNPKVYWNGVVKAIISTIGCTQIAKDLNIIKLDNWFSSEKTYSGSGSGRRCKTTYSIFFPKVVNVIYNEIRKFKYGDSEPVNTNECII